MSLAIKRALDICISSIGVTLLSPVLLFLAAIILSRMGRPVLFQQVRAGKDGRPFRVRKFRTMTNVRDADGNLLPDGQRQTNLGNFLRDWSLDELPQFFNVLGGSMSLVGPRPLPLRYLSRYNERQRLRLSVKPGITGLAQVSGRSDLDWGPRLELDVRYVESWSLGLDLRLMFQTVGLVFRRAGVIRPGVGVEFWGNDVEPPPGINAVPLDENEVVSPPSSPP
jgi:sugar transferase EpsL